MNLSQIILVQTEMHVYDTHFSNMNDADIERADKQNNFYPTLKGRNILQ